MSYIKVKEYFENLGLGDRVIKHEETSETVEAAAKVLGCKPEHIAKSMCFIVNDDVVMIVMSGEAKIDNSKYKKYFGVKAKMVPFDSVEELVGHTPGGVCPFVVNKNVKVYLDISLKRSETLVFQSLASNKISVRVEDIESAKPCCISFKSL